ncbi:Tol-Pal system beta propeller repeat protein TolB [Oceanomicrobium pacificus]|uniref:Tol-Pal system protein TolB n=1 Tax=Oceanomicrobium pacificus TaxID=2692916 RepID=A0A6B0TN83_9RHOB|nr:Tol-Pal system beta propeller repeat protein TolB [Oceanomicrobium pacificus]MXU65316.1 Tol-Pal system protein TolB [Oceanomicrobium pacificus]
MRFGKLGRIVTLICLGLAPLAAQAQSDGTADRGPLRIEITDGVIEPMPIAIPGFVPANSLSGDLARDITDVITADLVNSGLFRKIQEDAYIARVTSFEAPVQFADWKAINAQALITGSAEVTGDGRYVVKFRLWDVFAQAPLGEGLQFVGGQDNWRRLAHKVADAVYSRLTGESGYFDSRIVYVSEQGPKNARLKQLAIMDQDGANHRALTGTEHIVIAPRFSPNNDQILYTSYESGLPRVYLLDVNTLQRYTLDDLPGMTFSPRFAPDGNSVLLSLSDGGNTDIYSVDLVSKQRVKLTDSNAIDTAPSYSPDGSQIVFESDRGGSQQLYVMPATGGEATRISFGNGRYGTPVWSPRGDLIAFTKIQQGRFHIGVMRVDGSDERLLTASFLDEAPTWSPNGRVIMFFRESAGANGAPQLYSVDITGQNLRRVPTPEFGSDPSWSGLLR